MSVIPIGPSMRFQNGVDSQLQQSKAEAIRFDAVTNNAGGQIVTSSFKKITSQEELHKSMSISAGVAISYGLLNVDLKMSFSTDHSVNDYSIYMLATATVKNPPRFMVNRQLLPEAQALAISDIDQFRRTYGDSFIDEIYGGGEFYGLFVFTAHDEHQHREISASLDVSYGGLFAGGEIKAEFKQAFESASKKASTQIWTMRSGGSGIQNPTTLEELLTIYKDFNAMVAANPVDYQASVVNWENFPLPPVESRAERVARTDCVETCGRRITAAIQQRSKIEFIKAKPEQFINPNIQDLDAHLQVINERIHDWAVLARDCVDDLDKCNLADLDEVNVAWPERLQTADPLLAKWQDIRQHHSEMANQWFREEWSPAKVRSGDFEYDEYGGGRYWIFKKDNAPISGIFWHPAIDNGRAHAVYSEIFQEYYYRRQLCEGSLGFPTSDEEVFRLAYFHASEFALGGEICLYDFTGQERVSWFQNGVLWWDGSGPIGWNNHYVRDKLPDFRPERTFLFLAEGPPPPIEPDRPGNPSDFEHNS